MSVGVGVNIQHLAATPVGFTVTAKAEVVAVSDNTVTLKVEAYDDVEKIGEGMHVRAPIDMARFGKRVIEKNDEKERLIDAQVTPGVSFHLEGFMRFEEFSFWLDSD